MGSAQCSHRDRPSVPAHFFEVIRVFRMTVGHEVNEKSNSGSSLRMTDEVDFVFRRPLPVYKIRRRICEKNRALPVGSPRLCWTLIFWIGGVCIEEVTVVNIQAVAACLYVRVICIVGNEAVMLSTKRDAKDLVQPTYFPVLSSWYSSHARSQFDESGAIELTMTV
jgi:hypothetical protein